MKKRKNGEGSYGEKTIKGVKYKYYRSPNMEWEVYAKTSKELEAKKKAREQKESLSAIPDKALTISDLCEKWLYSVRKELSPGTYDAYENALNCRIRKNNGYDIGNKQASKLIPEMVESYLSSLAERYSKGTIDKTWTVLNQTILYGQKQGYIPPNFDFKNIKKPKESNVAVKKKDIKFITLSDMEKLFQESLRVTSRGTLVYGNASKLIVFTMYSGLRVGEAIGLKWENVSSDYSSIRVIQSGTRVVKRNADGSPIMENDHKTYINIQKGTKTESGERIVPLPKRAVEILQYFNSEFPDHKPDDNVFLTAKGTVFNRRNIERTLERMLKRSDCDCKEYTPHSLRHGYGSVLLSEGVDIKTVSVLLGHKDVSTTYNIYIHVLENDKIKAVRNVFDK